MKMAKGKDCFFAHKVWVTMRDGIKLATTVYLPLKGGPHPAVLVRTAYNRIGFYDPFFVKNNIALVTQDCRGRYESGGNFYPFVNEPDDGFDTLQWIGKQPWCNGKIGMFGDSYLAATQLLVAPLQNKFLKVINPRFMAADCWKHAYYCDGAFSLALSWSWLCFETATKISHAVAMPLLDVKQFLKSLPIINMDERSGAGVVPYFRDYVSHCKFGKFWHLLRLSDKYDYFKIPVLLTAGWYDNYAAEAVNMFTGLQKANTNESIKKQHRLIIGPWTHGINYSTTLGELDFGPEAEKERDSTQRWLNCILKNKPATDFQKAPIRIFVMGKNYWRDEQEWPLKRTCYTYFYLRTGRRLDAKPPATEESPDCYVYDPENPVPTCGGNHSVGPYNPGLYDFVKPGPYDQHSIEQRNDVLIYTSRILARDIEITGHVKLFLYASSSAKDTDFVARLTDVYPDRRSINITEGILRVRFRKNIWGKPELLVPDKIYLFEIDMQVTSNVFMAGHKIRLQITSSNFPLWDRNLNTGNNPATDTRYIKARQTIFHSPKYPSALLLPIIPY